ncbi:MAG: hypothetical protein BMS9Abin20_0012 [Acidimicrobiia bacterium]|nr:MAG: hypothetical protein BMS9Abin20_0012 [Acidimicrobiia bacterium]
MPSPLKGGPKHGRLRIDRVQRPIPGNASGYRHNLTIDPTKLAD